MRNLGRPSRSDFVQSWKSKSLDFHEACFYSYGSDHQECMVHIERYLKDSMGNEKGLTWNVQMLELIREMIHENNMAPAEGIAEEKIAAFEARYDSIVQTAAKEYEDAPPSDYYRDGYNLYLRMISTTTSCSCPIPLWIPTTTSVSGRPGY